MFDPLNQNGDDEIDFSEKNLFEGLPVDEICKNTVDFPEEEFKKPEKGIRSTRNAVCGLQPREPPGGNRRDTQPEMVHRHTVSSRVQQHGTEAASAVHELRESLHREQKIKISPTRTWTKTQLQASC